MDIQPTIVEVRDIVIVDEGVRGGAVTFQVLGTQNATFPLMIPLGTLRAFAQKVLDIDIEYGREPRQVPLPPPFATPEDAGIIPEVIDQIS